MIERALNQLWYEKPRWYAWPLLPIAWVYQAISCIRRYCLTKRQESVSNVPIIVVGNITVGGVGKTPLVIAMTEHFKQKGYQVGIVSRGYGAKCAQFPHEITSKDDAKAVGDEPYLLAQKTGVPVVIAPKRVQAVDKLLQHHKIDLIISDDGLQHHKMARDIEVVVVDGTRGFGNGFCLPAGPLRESQSRLNQVDLVVMNGAEAEDTHVMQFEPGGVMPCPIPEACTVAAFAGIGHPKRFFDTLNSLNIKHTPYTFDDHHVFKSQDFEVKEDVVLMTEKDYVKCQNFTRKPIYVLPVGAKLSAAFWDKLEYLLGEYVST